jgi:hypothetical protein
MNVKIKIRYVIQPDYFFQNGKLVHTITKRRTLDNFTFESTKETIAAELSETNEYLKIGELIQIEDGGDGIIISEDGDFLALPLNQINRA